MSARPYVSFAEVKEKVPLPDVLEVLGIANQFTRHGDKLTGACPLPDHKHGPQPNREQFKIGLVDNLFLWHCFGDCQRGGDVVEFVKAMTGYGDAHVRLWFAEHFGDRLTLKKPAENGKATKKKAREARVQIESSQAVDKANVNVSDEPAPIKPLKFYLQLERGVPYLKQRSVTEETAERYGLGFATRGTLKGYLAIPVYGWPHQEGRNPVGYIGRWPGEDYDADAGRPRYKVPDGFETSRVVYGLPQALGGNDSAPLIVVEGCFKVFHLAQAGFPNVVSCFTSSVSDEQATILSRTGRRIVLMFDGDEAGYEGMRRAAGRLITKAFVRAVKLPNGVEPDGLTREELRFLLTLK